MDLKQAASLLGWSRDNVRTAITDGLVLPGALRPVRLNAVDAATDYDIAEGDLERFIADCEALEPGRHPPAVVRRQLLIESRYRCAVCSSDAPLHYHHIIAWSDIAHHDPQHMLAVCGTCHDKITRRGEIDPTAQRAIKQRLAGQAPSGTAVDVAPLPSPPATEVSPHPIDGSTGERLAVRTPRGLILLDDVRYSPTSTWSVTLSYYDLREGWRYGTHYHETYRAMWRGPGGDKVQCRKMRIPHGDWVYAYVALDLAQEIRHHGGPLDLTELARGRRGGGVPIQHLAAGEVLTSANLLAWPLQLAGTDAIRDVIAEAEYVADLDHPDAESLRNLGSSLRHEAARAASAALGTHGPSQRFIDEVIGDFGAAITVAAIRTWLRRLAQVLREAIRPI